MLGYSNFWIWQISKVRQQRRQFPLRLTQHRQQNTKDWAPCDERGDMQLWWQPVGFSLKYKHQEEETRRAVAPSGSVCEVCGWFDREQDLAARVCLYKTSGQQEHPSVSSPFSKPVRYEPLGKAPETNLLFSSFLFPPSFPSFFFFPFLPSYSSFVTIFCFEISSIN